MKVSSGQHCENLTRKLTSGFDFDPKNGLRMVDWAKSINFVWIGAALKIRVLSI